MKSLARRAAKRPEERATQVRADQSPKALSASRAREN
jgi:hypothetical protein